MMKYILQNAFTGLVTYTVIGIITPMNPSKEIYKQAQVKVMKQKYEKLYYDDTGRSYRAIKRDKLNMFTAGGSHARLPRRQGTDLWNKMVCK